MEIKLLLAKAIGAAYYASHCNINEDALHNVLESAVAHVQISDERQLVNTEKSSLLKLRALLIWLKHRGSEKPMDLDDLMTRVRIATGDNDRLYDLFCKTLLLVDDPQAAKDKYEEFSHELMSFSAVQEFEALIRKASRRLAFERDSIKSVMEFRNEIVMKLQNLSLGDKKRAAAIARSIDVDDLESMAEVFNLAQTAIDPKSILKHAIKAFNRMTGDQDGYRRGEWLNVSALPGQNKSGNLLDFLVSMCCYNSPVLFDETKIPLHVYTTIEDKLELVFQKLYIMLKQQEYNWERPIDIRGLSPIEMATYVRDRLQERGFKVKFQEFTGGQPYTDYIESLRSYQEEGYEIISAGLDYANLMGKQGIPVQTAGDEVQGVHRYTRHFTSPNNIFHYTAHQLSTQAKEEARMYPDDYLARLVGKGYYEGCKKLDTEFDFEYFIAKRVHAGVTWQEVQWGKHRKLGATNEDHKRFALRFLELGMIGFKYDLFSTEDISYKKVGGRLAGGEQGRDFSDFDE
jgi:hypothetical protein